MPLMYDVPSGEKANLTNEEAAASLSEKGLVIKAT